jgi:microcystin-dependent protein
MKQGISLPQIPKKLQADNKELYDYLFGLQQALLTKQTDDYSAVDSGSVPIGTILMYAVATAPSNYLICNGAAISRTTYNKLFAVIGTAYGTGDGTTTFNLPNYQAVVPKGVGTQTINTRAKTAPAFATVEEDQGQLIEGSLGNTGEGGVAFSGSCSGAFVLGTNTDNSVYTSGGSGHRYLIDFDSSKSTGARAGTTTRENSIGTNFIIRYQ